MGISKFGRLSITINLESSQILNMPVVWVLNCFCFTVGLIQLVFKLSLFLVFDDVGESGEV